MRKLVSLAIAILFVASSLPVFAEVPAVGTDKCKMKLPFQIMADSMKVGKAKEKNQLIPLTHKPMPSTWQALKDEIKQSHENAKKESLRTPK
jgi:hypothetical protein